MHHAQDSRAAQAHLRSSMDLQASLTQSAQAQGAKIANEATQLAATCAVEQALHAWQAITGMEAGKATTTEAITETADASEPTQPATGGNGTTPAPSRPDLLLTSPAGITAHTPAHHIATAGNTLSLSTAQDLNLTAGANLAAAAKDGIVLYTAGEARNASKPNQEAGIKLHAASGSVSLQAQSGTLNLNAQHTIAIDSTQGSVRIAAPQRIQLVGAGTALEIDGANITLTTPGSGGFHAAMKEWEGGIDAKTPGLELAAGAVHLPPSTLHVDYVDAYGDAAPGDALSLKSECGATHQISGGTTQIDSFKKSLTSIKRHSGN